MWTRWMALLCGVLIGACGLGGCCSMESRFITPRDRLVWETPERAEDVWIDASGGGRIHGWLFRPLGASSDRMPAILYLHGRADSIALYRDAAPAFADAADAVVLMIDYRGWGRSSDPACVTRKSMLSDAKDALAYLRGRADVDASRLALWGVSLGGYPATALFADEPDVRAMSLWASPADAKWLLNDHRKRIGVLPSLVGSIGIRRWREPRFEIQGAGERPVLIVHGLRDGVVRVRHGIEIVNRARAAEVNAELIIEDAGHEGLTPAGLERVTGFFRSQLHDASQHGGDVELLREAVGLIASHGLGREAVDWRAVEHDLTQQIEDSGMSAEEAIRRALEQLGDPHVALLLRRDAESLPQGGGTTQEEVVSQTPPVPTRPHGRMLDDGCAYVLVPGCASMDVEALREFAFELANEIGRIAELKPRGWVIDLRLNGGGNVWPMLLGLESLLGRGSVMTMVGADGQASRFGVSDGRAWIDWGQGEEVQLAWDEGVSQTVPMKKGRIAVLIGPWTMSSGEALALSLRSGAGARVFGEPSAGLTTVTNFFALGDGSTLVLPVSRMGDLQGVAVIGAIVPDTRVGWGDWPSADDAAAVAARVWATSDD